MTRRVVLLGSTGSIGTQALDVIERNPDRFTVVGLAAGHDTATLREQAERFAVGAVAVGADAAASLVAEVEADVVLNAITGAAGLAATLATLATGATLALANKESLVVGGDLVRAQAAPGQIVPVDSEHSAIVQCLTSGTRAEVDRLILTASGGPFRGWTRTALHEVTPAQALAHPTWNMGRLVTTNSATLVNKGLEIIEAHYLFDVPYSRIDAVVHPQSRVHSMVQFIDGSTIAQIAGADMELPISLALDWPTRVPDAVPPVDWTHPEQWTFEPIDEAVFPAVRLARQVGEQAGTWPAVYNAANEVLVERFHAGELRFPDIVGGIESVLDGWTGQPAGGVDDVLAADEWGRRAAHQLAHSNTR